MTFMENQTQRMDCQVTNCVFTDDRSKLEKADAVLFHIVGNMKIRPKVKLMHQRWVFVEHEAPCGRWSELAPYISDFNWTQTFRLDSNLLMLYGSYCKRDQPIQIDFNTILKTKIKPVAWMVSNCRTESNRSEYVRELMKHIPIDVYGRCGYLFNQTNTCERFKNNECLKVIENKNKFYLSFENTLATDYITEKYFEKLGINIVPVVRGDGNYTAVGPPNSFINTNNFSSPKKLAEYLLYLHSHDEEYIKFLKWKEKFKSDGKCSMAESCWCKLCQRLNDPSEPIKYYPDIYEWFGDCRKPKDIIAS